LGVNKYAIGAQMGILYRCGIACPRRRQKQILHTHMFGRPLRARPNGAAGYARLSAWLAALAAAEQASAADASAGALRAVSQLYRSSKTYGGIKAIVFQTLFPDNHPLNSSQVTLEKGVQENGSYVHTPK
jgi:hypothetical protein